MRAPRIIHKDIHRVIHIFSTLVHTLVTAPQICSYHLYHVGDILLASFIYHDVTIQVTVYPIEWAIEYFLIL